MAAGARPTPSAFNVVSLSLVVLTALDAAAAIGCSSRSGPGVGPVPDGGAVVGGSSDDGGGCVGCDFTFTVEDAGSPTTSARNASIPVGASTIRPTFSPTVTASIPPPPISGGTLLVTRDGATAVAADPDRDNLYVVNLGTGAVTQTIALEAGDEPGRLVEDGSGRIHVALRAGGALVTIDPATGTTLSRRKVCPAPRGVAWDSSSDLVWVACATGELVALPAAGGVATTRLKIERDLRDVVVKDGSLSVTQFRSAQVLHVGTDGSIARRDQLPSPVTQFVPQVVWRAVAGPSGNIVALHQAESTQSLSTTIQGGYGGGCSGFFGGGPASPPPPIVQSITLPVFPGLLGDGGLQDADAAVTGKPDVPLEAAAPDGATAVGSPPSGCHAGDAGAMTGSGPFPLGCTGPESGAIRGVLTVIDKDGSVLVNTQIPAVLPVDVAVSADGSSIAAVAPGNAFVATLGTVFTFDSCGVAKGGAQSVGYGGISAQPIAVAFDAANDVIVQTREPAALWVLSAATGLTSSITLSSAARGDTGHDVFHTQAGGMVACASCHPEGRDDGHVWLLDGNRRRTPSLRGTIAGTAPYHWPGDQANLTALVDDVYTKRMNGAPLDTPQMGALSSWVQAIPAPPVPSWVDSAAAQRGKALFVRSDVACFSCHSGPKFTDNLTLDVGTGGLFQVPPLVGVGWRTPLMHDGCAATIADRFGACATPQHGSIGSLSAQNISDLTAYLESL